MTMEQPTGNAVLDYVPSELRGQLLSVAKRFSATDSAVTDGRINWEKYCVFMVDGFAIETVCLNGSAPTATFMYGPEGVAGLGRVLWLENHQRSPLRVQGDGLAISAASLARFLDENESLRCAVNRYLSAHMTVAARLLACGTQHQVAPRVACWLLMAADRCSSSTVTITQDQLASYLAASRSTVSKSCQPWIAGGIIRLSRGQVFILDRDRLENEACECYRFCGTAFAVERTC
jgi:hypothetical protein